MADDEIQSEQSAKPGFGAVTLMEYMAAARSCIEHFLNAQTDLMDGLHQANLQWFERLQSEANSVSDFVSRMTDARSMPDAFTVYQDWGSHQAELMAEDGRRLLDDTQKFIETGARLLAGEWRPKLRDVMT